MLERNGLTMELSEQEEEVLRIKQEILELERDTGFILTKNAEEIIKARDALKNAVPELDNWRTRTRSYFVSISRFNCFCLSDNISPLASLDANIASAVLVISICSVFFSYMLKFHF